MVNKLSTIGGKVELHGEILANLILMSPKPQLMRCWLRLSEGERHTERREGEAWKRG